MAELTAQMNIRMSRKVKEAGDAALASAGLSPSETVRALWEKAALRGEDLEEVVRLVRPSKSAAREDPDTENPVKRGTQIVEEGMRRLGISQLGASGASYEDLMEQALYDRLEERGLA